MCSAMSAADCQLAVSLFATLMNTVRSRGVTDRVLFIVPVADREERRGKDACFKPLGQMLSEIDHYVLSTTKVLT